MCDLKHYGCWIEYMQKGQEEKQGGWLGGSSGDPDWQPGDLEDCRLQLWKREIWVFIKGRVHRFGSWIRRVWDSFPCHAQNNILCVIKSQHNTFKHIHSLLHKKYVEKIWAQADTIFLERGCKFASEVVWGNSDPRPSESNWRSTLICEWISQFPASPSSWGDSDVSGSVASSLHAVSAVLHSSSWIRYHHLHFTDNKTETQRHGTAFPSSDS